MARLDDIQRRHNSAINILESAANGLRSRGRHCIARVLTENIAQANSAFADLLQYHKTFKGAVATAHEIERAKQ